MKTVTMVMHYPCGQHAGGAFVDADVDVLAQIQQVHGLDAGAFEVAHEDALVRKDVRLEPVVQGVLGHDGTLRL